MLDGPAVVAAYHSLWQVEKSFRMAKSDIRARPMFHHQRDSIEAHLTVVFAALAVARHLQDATGISIKKLVQTLKPLRTVTIDVNGHELTAPPAITADTADTQEFLNSIAAKSTHKMWHESGQSATGLSLRRIIKMLQPLREGLVEINGTLATIPAALTPEAKEIFRTLPENSGH